MAYIQLAILQLMEHISYILKMARHIGYLSIVAAQNFGAPITMSRGWVGYYDELKLGQSGSLNLGFFIFDTVILTAMSLASNGAIREYLKPAT